ncbi:MAG: glycosyltransferase family 4 protein [Bryobacterales bacterium]|nr:glycosyltransferase family 4 protein [Bryobacterales bacterium]
MRGTWMRIAEVAPLYESVPPQLYGGTERVVSYLTEELVKQGHDVTLFASGDSETAAKLISPCKKSLRLDPDCRDSLAAHIVMLDEVYRRAKDFEFIHFHTDYLHFALASRMSIAHVTTLHGRLDLPELKIVYRQFPELPLISISDDQRRPIWWANWRATIYHGLPSDLYRLHPDPGKYLAFIGRVSPEKRLDRAIELAIDAGVPLRIAAKVDEADKKYFESEIKPKLDHPLIEWTGEIGEHEKQEFLGNAIGLLFLIDWPEPFGLVMIEAMACGTPVIAFNAGSVPEVIDDGSTGFVVKNMDQARNAVRNIETIGREGCRRVFERRFTADRMAADYLAQFSLLIKQSHACLSAADVP